MYRSRPVSGVRCPVSKTDFGLRTSDYFDPRRPVSGVGPSDFGPRYSRFAVESQQSTVHRCEGAVWSNPEPEPGAWSPEPFGPPADDPPSRVGVSTAWRFAGEVNFYAFNPQTSYAPPEFAAPPAPPAFAPVSPKAASPQLVVRSSCNDKRRRALRLGKPALPPTSVPAPRPFRCARCAGTCRRAGRFRSCSRRPAAPADRWRAPAGCTTRR